MALLPALSMVLGYYVFIDVTIPNAPTLMKTRFRSPNALTKQFGNAADCLSSWTKEKPRLFLRGHISEP